MLICVRLCTKKGITVKDIKIVDDKIFRYMSRTKNKKSNNLINYYNSKGIFMIILRYNKINNLNHTKTNQISSFFIFHKLIHTTHICQPFVYFVFMPKLYNWYNVINPSILYYLLCLIVLRLISHETMRKKLFFTFKD